MAYYIPNNVSGIFRGDKKQNNNNELSDSVRDLFRALFVCCAHAVYDRTLGFSVALLFFNGKIPCWKKQTKSITFKPCNESISK